MHNTLFLTVVLLYMVFCEIYCDLASILYKKISLCKTMLSVHLALIQRALYMFIQSLHKKTQVCTFYTCGEKNNSFNIWRSYFLSKIAIYKLGFFRDTFITEIFSNSPK